MHVPVPKNRLVALTLVGALLTMLVAGGLAFPDLGLVEDQSSNTLSDAPASQQAAGDVPTPNQNFTPAVQSSGGEYEEEHEDEYGEDEEYGEDDHEEEYEHEEEHEG